MAQCRKDTAKAIPLPSATTRCDYLAKQHAQLKGIAQFAPLVDKIIAQCKAESTSWDILPPNDIYAVACEPVAQQNAVGRARRNEQLEKTHGQSRGRRLRQQRHAGQHLLPELRCPAVLPEGAAGQTFGLRSRCQPETHNAGTGRARAAVLAQRQSRQTAALRAPGRCGAVQSPGETAAVPNLLRAIW